ncbi:MAG TPA: nucleic acid-binding protein, partial [Blastocatellia bacterium]
NYFAEAGAHARQVVAEMCGRVMSHPQIVVLPQTRESFLAGYGVYRDRLDKGYSLTDCISMCAMRQRHIGEVLTHDHHFEQEGFSLLL